MNIPSVAATAPIPAWSTQTATDSAPERPARRGGEIELDQVTRQPLPPRYPWLSRLTQELEPAAPRRSAFAPAPILGDRLDRSA